MFENTIILAGGNGSRMKPLTNYVPKALVEIKGIPLVEHTINFLKRNKTYVYLTYNYKSKKIFSYLRHKVDGFINTTNQDNSYFLFNSFLKNIDSPILVVPCDLIFNIDLNKLYKDYYEKNEPTVMIVGVEPRSGIDGDFINSDEENYITSLSRELNSNIYCSGIQVINPFRLNKICPSHTNFYDVWNECIEKKEIKLSSVLPTEWEAFDNIKQILK